MRMMRLAALGVAAAVLFVTPALAALVADVTIRARLFVNPGTATRELELTGAVASGQAGETVDILAKECGPAYRFYRVVAGVNTSEGGAWRLITNREPDYHNLPLNAYLRARWRGNQSEPVLVRVPAIVLVAWRPRLRAVDVSVSNWTSGQNLRGREVELQRKVAGTDQWVRVRRARLGRGAYVRYAGQTFNARFVVPTRGLTLRAYFPDSSGAPCFTAGFSRSFQS